MMAQSKDELSKSTPITKQTKQSNYSWINLGRGNYNHVWKSNFSSDALVAGESYKGPWVLKYAIPSANPVTNAMNEKNRAIRLWNEINPDLPKAGLFKAGWIAPYINGINPATDEEVATKLIEIFIRTKRIVIDAASDGNFTTTYDKKVILLDVDLALKRRSSTASINFDKNLRERFKHYWINPQLSIKMPKTLEITQNLLYLEDNLVSTEIDYLCENNCLTQKNIQALTWLRSNNKKITLDLVKQISQLKDSPITLTETLFEALTNKHLSLTQSASNQKINDYLFFSKSTNEEFSTTNKEEINNFEKTQ